MLKTVAILTVALAVQPTSPKQSSSHSAEVRKQQSAENNPVPLSTQPVRQNQASNNYQADTAEHHRDWLETAYFISGPIIGFLSIITAIAVFRQTKAHVDSERPWVLLILADYSSDKDEASREIFPGACWGKKFW